MTVNDFQALLQTVIISSYCGLSEPFRIQTRIHTALIMDELFPKERVEFGNVFEKLKTLPPDQQLPPQTMESVEFIQKLCAHSSAFPAPQSNPF